MQSPCRGSIKPLPNKSQTPEVMMLILMCSQLRLFLMRKQLKESEEDAKPLQARPAVHIA